LIGRKLALDGGEAVRSFLAEVEDVCAACSRGDGVLASIGLEIAKAHRACAEATTWLQAAMRSSPYEALPGSQPYLQMMGLLAGGFYLARGALWARRMMSAGAGDSAFFATRISVAQFFAEQLLPKATALLGPVTRGGGGPFQLGGPELGL
jgi:hypothetical protein